MAIARHKTRQRELREARLLVRRVQRGDPDAFELLYATYEGRIYRFCHRLTGREETAAALVELTFARALADLPEGPLDQLDVPAHLHATARALAFERNGEPLGARGAAQGEVAVANDRLPPLERAALALRDLEGRPDDEIAAALGIDRPAVPGLVGTARLHLLAELRPAGIAEPCPGRLPDLSAYSDGTLPPERRSELEAHVSACAACRATLFALREAALRYQALPTPDPPGELGSRIGRALGLAGLPARRSEAAEPLATGGRQTAAAVAMAALAVVGVGVTIAASHADHDNSKPTPAPPQPEAQPSAPASGSPLASRVVSLAAAKKLRPPPALHHLRAGAKRVAHAPRPRPKPVPQGLGKSFAPESPPSPTPPPAAPSPGTPMTTPKQQREIPVQIVPPVTPSHAQAAADEPSPPPNPPPAPEPPPPPQTTTT